MKTKRLLIIVIALFLCAGVVFGAQLNYKNKYKKAAKNIVLIEIDEDTLNKLGRWPFPRALFGKTIEKLSRNGTVTIVIDILFMENSAKEDDEAFRTAIEKSKNVILPILNEEPAFLHKAGAKYGAIAFYPDQDGVIKDMTTYGKDIKMPTIAALAASSFLCPNECRIRNTTITLRKPSTNFEKLSFYRVLEMNDGELKDRIKNKIVVVGVSHPGSFSARQTTWSDSINATDLLAAGISTMLVEKDKIFERYGKP